MTSFFVHAYVRIMHGLGRTPLFPTVEGDPPSRQSGNWHHWLASLPAIHDLDRMVALDSPWWTYKAIDAVSTFLNDRPGARVFEWGSGASTLWLAKRSGSVLSIEHDQSWFSFLNNKISEIENVTTKLIQPSTQLGQLAVLSEKPGWRDCDFSDYVRAICETEGQFDLIVIDGRVRSACLKHAVEKLSSSGVILFDNSHRKRYRVAIDSSGLNQSRMRGLTPSLPYPDETSLLTKYLGT